MGENINWKLQESVLTSEQTSETSTVSFHTLQVLRVVSDGIPYKLCACQIDNMCSADMRRIHNIVITCTVLFINMNVLAIGWWLYILGVFKNPRTQESLQNLAFSWHSGAVWPLKKSLQKPHGRCRYFSSTTQLTPRCSFLYLSKRQKIWVQWARNRAIIIYNWLECTLQC